MKWKAINVLKTKSTFSIFSWFILVSLLSSEGMVNKRSYSCSNKHPVTSQLILQLKTKCLFIHCFCLVCVKTQYFDWIFTFEHLMRRCRFQETVALCVCVMSAAPGRLCSTSHTVDTPSQSLYHSPASENKQEPLKYNCEQKLFSQDL